MVSVRKEEVSPKEVCADEGATLGGSWLQYQPLEA